MVREVCVRVFGWEDEKQMIKKRGVVEERWMIIWMRVRETGKREGRAHSQCLMLI